MNEKQFFKDLYYFEHERRSKLTTNLAIPIGVLTLVFGVVSYYLRNFGVLGREVWSVAFYVGFGATFLSVFFAIYFLIRSFYNYGYGYPPMPSDISRDIQAIQEYYGDPYFKHYGKEQKDGLIEKDIDALIVGYYKRCLEINIRNNNSKSKYLHRCSSSLIAVIILLFLSSIPFWIRYHSSPNIQNAEATDWRQEVRTVSDEQKRDDKPSKSPPPKPEPTRIVVIKERNEKPEELPKND